MYLISFSCDFTKWQLLASQYVKQYAHVIFYLQIIGLFDVCGCGMMWEMTWRIFLRLWGGGDSIIWTYLFTARMLQTNPALKRQHSDPCCVKRKKLFHWSSFTSFHELQHERIQNFYCSRFTTTVYCSRSASKTSTAADLTLLHTVAEVHPKLPLQQIYHYCILQYTSSTTSTATINYRTFYLRARKCKK
jgi:hypothetical protein